MRFILEARRAALPSVIAYLTGIKGTMINFKDLSPSEARNGKARAMAGIKISKKRRCEELKMLHWMRQSSCIHVRTDSIARVVRPLSLPAEGRYLGGSAPDTGAVHKAKAIETDRVALLVECS